MIDLDHFKQINDRYGHLTGDKCIKKTASVAANIIGDNNIIGRYGGEEFICILKDTNESDAFEMAEKIRLAVKKETGKLPFQPTSPLTLP